jgi:hypothetical protein
MAPSKRKTRAKTQSDEGPTKKAKDELTVASVVEKIRMIFPSDADNGKLVQLVLKKSKCADDPPLLFKWNYANLAAFLNKVALLVAPHPASPFQPPAGPSLSAKELTNGIIARLVTQFHVAPLMDHPQGVGNAVLGVACNAQQCLSVTASLGALSNHPWFAAVLAAGNQPLPGPLALLCSPIAAKNPTGACFKISCPLSELFEE